MTLEHRKSTLICELLHADLNTLVHTLAVTMAERDELKAKVAELEAKLSPKPE